MISSIDYFKSQAKHLHKDFESRSFDEKTGQFQYTPKYFEITKIFEDFNLPHQNADFTFTLMNAQHTISKLAGFSKWEDLKNASEDEAEFGKKSLNSSPYKLKTQNQTPVSETPKHILPAPQNLYALILPNGVWGINVEFSFDSVEYADSYMIYYSDENDISTAKPLAEGMFSPIKYTYRNGRQPAKFFWVRAFDGEEYGEWSTTASRNR